MMYSHKSGGPDVGNGKTGGPKDEPLVAGSPPGEDELVTEHEHMPFFLRYSTLISRLFGVITLTVLWSLTVLTLNDLSKYNAYAPWYLLAISLLTTLFELIWLFNKCATCRVGLKESQYDDSVSLTYDEIDLSRKDNCCCRCWRLMLWVDNWRKALLYVVFGVPMFVRNLVTVYTVICGLLLLILAALYFIKSFKESKCVARKPRKHSYVQTSNAPKPKYVQHPVQTYTGDYPPASHGYDSLGHTNSIQPPEYTQHPEQPKPQSQGTNYFRPFKDGVGNVQEEPNGSIPREPERNREIGGSIDGKRKSPEAKQKGVTERPSSSASPNVKSKDPNKSTSKDMTKEKSSPKEVREKPRGSSTEEGGFKLFGLRKKDEKPKEQVVTMVSSQRSVEEDLEQYPEDKNPFDDDEEDCEWDPNNRGQS